MKVVLTGGTGFIGTGLLPLLLRGGHHVSLLTRNPSRARLLLEKTGLSREDLEKVSMHSWIDSAAAVPVEAFEDAEAVIHLLGENIGKGRWTEKRKKELRDSRILSTRNLVAAFPQSVRHFLCASAVGIYPAKPPRGKSNEEWAVEQDFPEERNLTFLEVLCRDWEDAAREAEKKGVRVVRMRIGLVLGHDGFLNELLPLFRFGLGGPIGDGSQILPWIHIKDLVRAMMWLLEHDEMRGPYNLVGPNPVSFRTFGNLLAKLLGRPFLLQVPPIVLKMVLGEKAALPLASCPALPDKLAKSGFRFEYSMCSRALKNILSEKTNL